jgi:hypothetical protein
LAFLQCFEVPLQGRDVFLQVLQLLRILDLPSIEARLGLFDLEALFFDFGSLCLLFAAAKYSLAVRSATSLSSVCWIDFSRAWI